jgi:molecular chaperone DnaJ
MRDLYEVLGVGRDAGDAEIKKAYRRLAMEYHPDRNPGDKKAEDQFKEAANAYKVLSDPDQRARYDQFGPDGLNGNMAGFRGVDDIFSAFGDLFSDFFGGPRGGRRQRRGAGRDRSQRELRDLRRERRQAGHRPRVVSRLPGQGAGPARAGLLHDPDDLPELPRRGEHRA